MHQRIISAHKCECVNRLADYKSVAGFARERRERYEKVKIIFVLFRLFRGRVSLVFD
ncbi:MAG TPA: hypothetical protein VF721_03190 [Pyrinomonadaceae bacterium]